VAQEQELIRRIFWSGVGGRTVFFGRGTMSDSHCRALVGNSCLPNLGGLIEFAGLCGIAFCLGAGAGYLKNSHFWTTEAIAATEDRPQVVNRSRKGDRFPAMMMDRPSRPAGLQEGFGTLEVGGPPNATITVRDANGRLVFALDPLRRMTVISKREVRGLPSSKEPGGHVPKSTIVPVGRQVECDPPRSCLVASGSLQLVEEFDSRVQSDTKRQASLGTLARER
jgi:hypothetical protein